MMGRTDWPEGKDFAFTVFDDTDFQTADNVREVYDLLGGLSLFTTKSVWPIRGDCTPNIGGTTCEDSRYLKWVSELQAKGFEIALHNVTYHTSSREETIYGIERFHELFGHYPYSMANHSGCNESIYWGNYRLTGFNELIYNLLLRNKTKGVFQGHVETSPLFWGDICREKIKYVRNFVFGDINTLKMCPYMPYHDPRRFYVNYWFASSEGPDVDSFVSTLSERNQDRLARESGACIMYTHFAKGFSEGSRVHSRFRSLIKRMSRMNGWFVPVSTLLDYLLETRGNHEITESESNRLEKKWLLHKIRTGGTT